MTKQETIAYLQANMQKALVQKVGRSVSPEDLAKATRKFLASLASEPAPLQVTTITCTETDESGQVTIGIETNDPMLVKAFQRSDWDR